ETQQIAKMAEAAGIPCTIGSNLEREVATAAMAHVTTCTANIQCERFPGDLIGPLYYDASLSTAPLSYHADRLRVPEAPGLGIEVPCPRSHTKVTCGYEERSGEGFCTRRSTARASRRLLQTQDIHRPGVQAKGQIAAIRREGHPADVLLERPLLQDFFLGQV